MSIVKKCSSYLKERNYIPRLTVRGLIIHCANSTTNSGVQRFDWTDALIDAAIISGVTFFSTLGGGAVAGISVVNTVEAATVAAFSQFFIFLALKRGLIQPKETQS